MNTIIEKIRAKVESKIRDTNNDTSVGAMESLTISKTLRNVLSILSDIEKEEKPMNPQPVKIDIRKELASIEFMGVNDARDTETIARHFYELGKQSKPKVSEDVETEALRSAGVLLSEHFEDEDDDAIRTTALRCWKGGFIAGASWQKEQDLAEMAQSKSPLSVAYTNRCFENGKQAMKEQMMENALHGWLDEDNEPPYDLNVHCEEKIPFGKFKHCDKVKIIIVKED